LLIFVDRENSEALSIARCDRRPTDCIKHPKTHGNRDIEQKMPSQEDTQDTAGKCVQSKSPLLCLPAEIRNKIYGCLVIPPGPVVYLENREEEEVHRVSTHSNPTALLRTSRQIYEEATTLLYVETRFLYFWYEDEPFPGRRYSPNAQFRFVQNLELTFIISNRDPISIKNICRFLEALIDQQCSFKRLGLIYDHTPSSDDDPLRLESSDGAQLLQLTCAIEVRTELEIAFYYRYFNDGTPYPFLKDHVKDIAMGKSWIATESHRIPAHEDYAPEYMMRYLLHPEQAMLSNTR